MLSDEMREHLCNRLIPFWIKLRDTEHGGYYGWVDSELHVHREAVKGCILNSRILWFFSNVAMCLGKTGQDAPAEAEGEQESRWKEFDECPESSRKGPEGNPESSRRGPEGNPESSRKGPEGNPESSWKGSEGNPENCLKGTCGYQEGCREETGRWTEADLKGAADWAGRFLREKCIDREKGGVYWSVNCKGEPEDTTKHTYNQAFAVYALSAYFRAFHNREALKLAEELIAVIETECFDVHGYKEALDREFQPVPNDKLSENGVMADRTMNTLLHVMEAYTEYLLACREAGTPESAQAEPAKSMYGQEKLVEVKLRWILNLVETHIYNPELRRQEVFFDLAMNSLIDLHSYGHDIEAAWLMDRCLEVLGDEELTRKLSPVLRSMEQEVYEKAYTSHSLANECERGVVDMKRVWWVQAEGGLASGTPGRKREIPGTGRLRKTSGSLSGSILRIREREASGSGIRMNPESRPWRSPLWSHGNVPIITVGCAWR